MSDIPRRAVRLNLDIEADTKGYMLDALNDIRRRILCDELSVGISGGVSFGYMYEYHEDDRPTPDEYREQLTEYLAAVEESND